MINCLLIKVTHNKRGMPVRSYRTIVAETLSFGRGTECTVHLPDPRIAMHHAVIKRMDDGQIHLMRINGDITIDEKEQQSLVLTQDMQVMIGPYQLTVEPSPPDVNLTLSIVLLHRLPDDFQSIKARTHEPLPNAAQFKRRISMWLACVITLFFIVLPFAQNLIPQWHHTMAKQPFGFDRIWSPNRFSTAHQHFSNQCFKCHEAPFKKVADTACMHCHQDTPAHIENPTLQKRALKAAHRFVGSMRCAECHQEHKAPHPLARQDDGMCIKCHGNIARIDPQTKLSDVTDFEKNHPDFKITLQVNGGEVRVPQTETKQLVENSGLNFPHDQHIGKVQGPNGMWDIRALNCQSCHQTEPKAERFKPIAFNQHCVTCHANQLAVGSADTLLKLPHGAEQAVENVLRVYAPQQFAKFSEQLKTDGCAYCHVIESTATQAGESAPKLLEQQLSWRTAPLRLHNDWFSKAKFSHASHHTQACTACHQVENSTTSADIAMPDRASCLNCHAGNTQKHKRIASGCMSCHDFHSAHLTSLAIGQPKLSEHDLNIMLALPNQHSNVKH